jgi:calcineurin-like phosphoesterase family protein
MNNFFTSDTHFGHKNIIKGHSWGFRDFSSVDEMNETIISNWNSKVKQNDTVYHLGDFAFCDPETIIKRLNGNIYFIVGSHDKVMWKYKHLLIGNMLPLVNIKINNQFITLCHYNMRVWDKSHYNTFHLYGHSHGGLNNLDLGKAYDVGVDTNNFTPVSFDEIVEIMKKKPDNFNFIKKVQKTLDK